MSHKSSKKHPDDKSCRVGVQWPNLGELKSSSSSLHQHQVALHQTLCVNKIQMDDPLSSTSEVCSRLFQIITVSCSSWRIPRHSLVRWAVVCFLRHLSLAFICEAILYHYLNFSSLQGHEKWMFGTACQFLEKKKKLLEKFAHCPKTLFCKKCPPLELHFYHTAG